MFPAALAKKTVIQVLTTGVLFIPPVIQIVAPTEPLSPVTPDAAGRAVILVMTLPVPADSIVRAELALIPVRLFLTKPVVLTVHIPVRTAAAVPEHVVLPLPAILVTGFLVRAVKPVLTVPVSPLVFPAEANLVRDKPRLVRLRRYRRLLVKIVAEQLTIPVVKKLVPNKAKKIVTDLAFLPHLVVLTAIAAAENTVPAEVALLQILVPA